MQRARPRNTPGSHVLPLPVRLPVRLLLPWLLSSLLVGCTIGMPFPDLPAAAPGGARGEPVVLVLTHVVVDRARRGEFDRQNRRVLASMDQHPGLLGYSARRELFGENGWTMSVWETDEARAAFVRTGVHREAIARSMPALVRVRLRRVTVERDALPEDWDDVLRLLDMPEGTRTLEGGARQAPR
jgi:hypothetical protein